MADTQRSQVYGAEQHVRRLLDSVRTSQARTVQAYGSTLTIPDERQFADLASIQRYVDAVLALDWVGDTWPESGRALSVRKRKGQAFAHYSALLREIAIPTDTRWAMREIVLLHEIAHHLTPGSQHGPSFVGAFLLLVREIIGPEVHLLLLAAMDEAGVKIRCCQPA
jgi:putative metallohydrolase (TIGR04338 family)